MNFFEKIHLENYRNFNNYSINLNQDCNVIYGINGSGKTNILESISLFERGRGFRKEKINNLINNKSQNKKFKINTYLAQSSFINDELFKKYRSYFPSPFPENSLLETHPELSEEWDYEKNYPLRPENFSYGSHQKVLWICPIGHSNKSVIQSRTDKKARGCPYCSGRKKLSR